MARPARIPTPTRAAQAYRTMPGTFVNGSSAVATSDRGPACTATRRGRSPRPSSRVPAGGAHSRARCPGRLTGRASTIQVPSVIPGMVAVSATGPVPGFIPSKVSSYLKLSLADGFSCASVRRPVNRTVTGYGPPSSPGSSQQVTIRTWRSARSAQPVLSPGAGAVAAASAVAASGPVTARDTGEADMRGPETAGRGTGGASPGAVGRSPGSPGALGRAAAAGGRRGWPARTWRARCLAACARFLFPDPDTASPLVPRLTPTTVVTAVVPLLWPGTVTPKYLR